MGNFHLPSMILSARVVVRCHELDCLTVCSFPASFSNAMLPTQYDNRSFLPFASISHLRYNTRITHRFSLKHN